MKKRMTVQSVSRHQSAQAVSAFDSYNSAVPFTNALRFYFFAFIFTQPPICKNCP